MRGVLRRYGEEGGRWGNRKRMVPVALDIPLATQTRGEIMSAEAIPRQAVRRVSRTAFFNIGGGEFLYLLSLSERPRFRR